MWRFEIGESRIHLSSQSPLISKHHTNWRLRALDSLDEPKARDLHYSLALTASEKDGDRLRALFLETLSRAEEIYRPSREEVAYSLCMDFFEI